MTAATRKPKPADSIRFGTGKCSLGQVLVASTEKGVCCILLGDDPAEMLANLQDRFPTARIFGGDADHAKRVAEVIDCLEAPRAVFGLALDAKGTPFQQLVWQALREIPAGSTVSYATIAERIGSPKSVRAVAGACAANPIAIAIPCHRVVRSDGNLSGYRWGIERKRALLLRERTI